MNAITIAAQGSPVAPNIRAVDDWAEEPSPGAGEAVIRVEASALNHIDLWIGRGVPRVDPVFPRVSGCDSCGIVETVGEGVDGAWLGRRVVTNAALRRTHPVHPDDPTGAALAPRYELIGEHSHGMHRERFTAPVGNIAEVGMAAEPTEAAAFGLVTLTAYSMMLTKGKLRPGQLVLITGIGGGVSTAALALAKWLACRVVVTSRHQWKLDRAEELGADETILDDGQDWSKEVRAWSGKRGVDMAVDSIGAPTHMNCVKSLARGGALVTPGSTGGARVETDQTRIFWNQLRVLGSTMGSNDEWREVVALFRAGQVRPVVDEVFGWRDARDAWARLEASEQFGKIVIDWS